MKTKKIHKKLSLEKRTIVNLNNDDMNVIKGGTSLDLCSQHPTCWVTKFCTRYCTDDCSSVCD